MNVKGTE
ncbi:Protein of unknown function [Bacillus wiedmannii]|nr:Protein of unknown function [Bacillus wiedmannii]